MTDDLAEGGDDAPRRAATPGHPDLDAPPLSQDNVFDALASRRSRYVLVCLRESDGPVDFEDVVEDVVRWETGKPADLVSADHRERVQASLSCSQLPKLSMMGLVTYDEARGVIERGPYAEQADAYLDIAVERDENVDL